MMWTLDEAIRQVGGKRHGDDARFASVGTDSRQDCTGQLFVALRGTRFDGHQHIAAARDAGAVAALVEHPLDDPLPQWIVDDTRLGLGRLAGAWRARYGGRVIAITGSNGKTTVKEMLAAILAEAAPVCATRGNLNNDIGMPLTLLGVRDEAFLALEMGANHPGEIAYMSAIAQPDVAIITNAGRAHLEGFGSVDGVARAKGEIVTGLPAAGVLIVAGDSPYTRLWRELAGPRPVQTFGFGGAPGELDVCAEDVRVDWNQDGFRSAFLIRHAGGEIAIALGLAGRHNVRNALAAATAALALGIDEAAIRAGLQRLRPVPGRLCPRRCGVLSIIDDTYNANPDSLDAAIEVLAGLSGQRWLVLGDLGELGRRQIELHAEIGRMARTAGIERLVSVGELSRHASTAFGNGGKHFTGQPELLAHLHAMLGEGDRVLIKGSRMARMERMVDALCPEGDQ